MVQKFRVRYETSQSLKILCFSTEFVNIKYYMRKYWYID